MTTTSQPKLERVEIKFHIDEDMSEAVKDWARDHLGIDENCNAEGSDSYDINSLYLDTAEFDILNGNSSVRRAKHRVRRYGNEDTLWLETKRKKKMVVRKNRTAVHESDFAPLRQVDHSDVRCDDWFVQRIADRRLQPAIQIAYRRFARTTTINSQALRLTIDSKMFAGPVDGWRAPQSTRRESLLKTAFGDCEILELKFNGQMPRLFKLLLQTFVLPASGFSKYRTAMKALQHGSIECDRRSDPKSVEFACVASRGNDDDIESSAENG